MKADFAKIPAMKICLQRKIQMNRRGAEDAEKDGKAKQFKDYLYFLRVLCASAVQLNVRRLLLVLLTFFCLAASVGCEKDVREPGEPRVIVNIQH